MSSRNGSTTQTPRDSDLAGAEAAIHRAAQRARQRAEATARVAGTPDRSTENSGGIRKVQSRHDPQPLTFSQAQGYEEIPAVTPEEGGAWGSRNAAIQSSLRFDSVRSASSHLPNRFCGRHEVRLFALQAGLHDRRWTTSHHHSRRHPREGGAVVEALQTLRKAGLGGAASHLRNASECINARDWAGSARESIHAVESVARQLDPAASKALRPALTSLERSGTLHPALKEAFNKLYGYTSDEQGVRHALLDRPDHNVGMDEALFMLSACASFASYLWRKHVEGQAS